MMDSLEGRKTCKPAYVAALMSRAECLLLAQLLLHMLATALWLGCFCFVVTFVCARMRETWPAEMMTKKAEG